MSLIKNIKLLYEKNTILKLKDKLKSESGICLIILAEKNQML